MQSREWGDLQSVLLHEPGTESLLGLLATHPFHFGEPFDVTGAKWEHQNLRFLLEARDVQVFTLRNALTEGALDWNGEPRSGEALKRLKRAVNEAIEFTFSDQITHPERSRVHDNWRKTLDRTHPNDLAELILLSPRLHIKNDPCNQRLMTEYHLHPSSQLHSIRDSSMITRQGIIIGRSAHPERRWEQKILHLAIAQLGIASLCTVESPGVLEGGDFVPAGEFVFQGEGACTDRDGIEQVLEQGAYGQVEVAVVRDPDPVDQQRHLEDYFMMIADGHAVVEESRLKGKREPTVEVHQPSGNGVSFEYQQKPSVKFSDYLDRKGIKVGAFPFDGPSVSASIFGLGGREVVISARSRHYQGILEEEGFKVQVLEMGQADESASGGLHSLAQALVRR